MNTSAEIKALRKDANLQIRAIRKNTAQKIRELQGAEIGKRYSLGEEIFNSVSHGVGAGLAVAALVVLVVHAAAAAPNGERGFYITSFSIFGASLTVLYLMSTLYHALVPHKAKNIFAVFDHTSIYLLIAGTYTPFCLTAMRGALGWSLFGVIWGLAALGITFYAIFGNRLRALSAITYVLMGWLIVFALKPMSETLPELSLKFLLGGGVSYTVGCVFYALKKIKWMHSVWHLFVLGGSVLHFFSVYFLL